MDAKKRRRQGLCNLINQNTGLHSPPNPNVNSSAISLLSSVSPIQISLISVAVPFFTLNFDYDPSM